MNVHKDYVKQLDFLEEMAFLKASRIICLDGINFNPKDNLAKYGWSEMGREAITFQIRIASKNYAVMAAMSEEGFIGWCIYDHTVCNTDVASFIRERVAPMFGAEHVLLLDNAANQRHDYVILTMETELGGRFKFNVAYSPELNPIERGFALIRTWIRSHEHLDMFRGDDGAYRLINAAFHNYSIIGPEGDKCYGFFDLYRNNHQSFLDETFLSEI